MTPGISAIHARSKSPTSLFYSHQAQSNQLCEDPVEHDEMSRDLRCCLHQNCVVNNHLDSGSSLAKPAVSGRSGSCWWSSSTARRRDSSQPLGRQQVPGLRHLQQSWLHSQGGQQTNYQQVCAQQTMKKPYRLQTQAADAVLAQTQQRRFGNINESVAAVEFSDKNRKKKKKKKMGEKRKTCLYRLRRRRTRHVETCSLKTCKSCFNQRTQAAAVWRFVTPPPQPPTVPLGRRTRSPSFFDVLFQRTRAAVMLQQEIDWTGTGFPHQPSH